MKRENMRAVYIRLKRYIHFWVEYYFYEKPRGLDFTMRDIKLYQKSGGIYHGYSKTSEKHLQDIFKRLSYEDARLLDVGCGKGVVLKEVLKFPFQKVAGIEIQKDLVQIARKNFEIMGMEKRIECIHVDAVDFNGYGDYNVFFFFNPFSEEVLRQVVDKIIADRGEADRDITIIYHNPRFIRVFEEKTKVLRKEMLYDSLKDYDTCILELCI